MVSNLTLISSPILGAVLSGAGVAFLLRWRDHLPIDRPNERSLHTAPVPRVGGVALFFSLIATVSVGLSHWPLPLVLAVSLAVLSFLDDRFGLPVLLRLFFHFVAAGLVLSAAGIHSPLVFIPLLFALVWSTNLYNFMDGSDGLAGGMALFGFAFYAAASLQGGDRDLAVLSLSVCGAAAGFLVHNFPPARVFMGDAGSIPLGFLAGAVGVVGWRKGLWPLGFPIFVFAPFVVDATVTLVRRTFQREPIWKPHRSHYYQRLVQMGWGHKRTALVEYLGMAVCGGAAFATLRSPLGVRMLLIALVGGVAVGGMVWVDRRWKASLVKES